MTHLLSDVKNATSWMDDILIWSSSITEHFKHLCALFMCIWRANLKLKLPKCHLFRLSLRYVGFIVSLDTLRPDKEKIIAIKNMKPPTNVTGVWRHARTKELCSPCTIRHCELTKHRLWYFKIILLLKTKPNSPKVQQYTLIENVLHSSRTS